MEFWLAKNVNLTQESSFRYHRSHGREGMCSSVRCFGNLRNSGAEAISIEVDRTRGDKMDLCQNDGSGEASENRRCHHGFRTLPSNGTRRLGIGYRRPKPTE